MKKILSFILVILIECTMIFDALTYPINAVQVDPYDEKVKPFFNLDQLLKQNENYPTKNQEEVTEKQAGDTCKEEKTKDKMAGKNSANENTNENNDYGTKDNKWENISYYDNGLNYEYSDHNKISLNIPTGLRTIETSDFIVIVWDAVNYAERYELEIDGHIIDCGNKTMYVQSDLKDMSVHKYRVRAVTSNITGEWSEYIEGSLDKGIFDSPCDIISFPTSNYIILCWSTVKDAKGYEIEVDGQVINNGLSTNYIHQGLTPNTTHTYRVRAIEGENYTKWSNCITETTLDGVVQNDIDSTEKCDKDIESAETSVKEDINKTVQNKTEKAVQDETKAAASNDKEILEQDKNIKAGDTTAKEDTNKTAQNKAKDAAQGETKAAASNDKEILEQDKNIKAGDTTAKEDINKTAQNKTKDAAEGETKAAKNNTNTAEELSSNLEKAYAKLKAASNERISNNIAAITSSIKTGVSAASSNSYNVDTSEIEYKAEGFFRGTGGASVDRWEELGRDNFAEVNGAPIERIKISSVKKPDTSTILKYQVYVYDKSTGNGAWQSVKSEGEEAGENGKSITSIKIWLEGNDKYEVRYNSITDMTSSIPEISDYVYNGVQTLDPSINKKPILNFVFEVIESLPKVNVSTYDNTKGSWTSTKDIDGFIGSNNSIGKIKLTTNKSSQGFKLKYQVFIKENGAWQDWKSDGEEAGEKGKTITNIRAKIEGADGYLLRYKFKTIDDKSKVSVSEYGKNGYEPKSLNENLNNITGFFFEVLKSVPKVEAYTYFKDVEKKNIWLYSRDTGLYGPGVLPIHKIKILLKDAPSDTNIKYQVYLKNKNKWQEWKRNGEIAGLDDDYITNIRIKIDGETFGSSIKYYFENSEDANNHYISEYGYNGAEPAGSSANTSEICRIGIFMCNEQPISNLDLSGDVIVLDGKYEIPEGTVFTIPSGKKIVLDYSKTKNVGFVVNGTLVFKGTESNPIKLIDNGEYNLFTIGECGKLIGSFINVNSSRKYGTEALIENKGELDLSNSSFTSSIKGTYFLDTNSSKSVNIDSCIIDSWADGIIINGTGNFGISKSTIKNNKIGIVIKDGNGYSITNKIKIIDNPNISNNEVGIYVNRIGSEALHKKLEITSNIFDGNASTSLEFYCDNLSNIILERNKIKNNNKDGKYKLVTSGEESSMLAAPISINLGILRDTTNGSTNFINSINNIDAGCSNIIESGNSIDAIVLYEKLTTTLQLKAGKYQYAIVNLTLDKGGKLLIDEGCQIIFDGVIDVKSGQLIINGTESKNVRVNCISSSGVTYNSSAINYEKSRFRVIVENAGGLNATYTTFFRGGTSKGAAFDVSGLINLNNCTIDNDKNTNVVGILGNTDKSQVSLTKVTIKNCSNGVEGKCGKIIGCNFTNNNIGVYELLGGCQISNCTIINNKAAGVYAIKDISIYNSTIKSNCNNVDLFADSSSVKFVLYNNTISDANNGIDIKGTSNIDIQYNNIYNHKYYGLTYLDSTKIKVPYNYWGNSNGPSAYYWYTDYYGKRNRMYKNYGDKISNESNNIDFSPCSISFIHGIDLGIDSDQISKDSYKILSDYAYNLKKSLYTNGVNAASGNYSKIYNDLLVNSKGIDINLSRIYSSRNSTAVSVVTIRSAASETSNKIGTLNKGDIVQVLEIAGDWCKISVNNLVGYVSTSNLDITESIINLNVTGIVKMRSSSSKLNVRSQASTNSRILGTLSNGATVSILAVEGNWFKINYNGGAGYVSMDYVKLSNSDSVTAAGTVKVSSSSGYLNVRNAPSTSASIIGKLDRGNTVNITGVNGNWYKINYNGADGYVSQDYVVLRSVVTTKTKKSGTVKISDSPAMLGRGWTFYYESSIEGISDVSSSVTTEGKVVTLPGGEVYAFKKNSDGTYTALDSRCTLTESNGEFIVKNKENTSYYFNSSCKLYKITDNKNNSLYFAYSGKLLTKIYDDSGRVYNLTYSGGLLINITEVIDGESKRTINYNFNSSNMLESVKDVNGNIQEQYIYDSNYRLYQIKQDNTILEQITYITEGDNEGKIDTLTTVTGLVNKYTYDNSNNLVTITDSLGNTNQTMYDSGLNVVYTIDQNGNFTVNNYILNSNKDNAFKELSSQRDKYGYVTSYIRDDRGNITKIFYADKSSVEYVYDKYNNVIEEINQNGNKTFYEYDSTGAYLLKIIQPLNGTDDYTSNSDAGKFAISTFEYYDKSDSLPIAGLIKKITKASGGCIEYTYDKFGNILSETDLSGNVTRYSYDKFGNKVKVIDPNGFNTTYSYDNKGKILTKSNTLGETTQYLYDKYDRNIGQIDPNDYSSNTGVITMKYTYDSAGRVTSQIDSLGNVVEYTYDVYGNKISEKNSLGGIFLYAYDRVGRVVRISFKESVDSKETLLQEFSYKISGGDLNQVVNVIKTIKTYTAEGNSYTTVDKYNYLNAVVEHINADGSKEFTTYDGKGNILCKIPENGAPTYCYYDYNNNLIKCYEAVKVAEEGNFKYRETKYTYNLDGIKTSVSVGLELVDKDCEAGNFYTTTYNVDKRGLVLSEIDSEGRETRYTYDNNGNNTSKKKYLTKDTYIMNEYEYNKANRLISESIIVKKGDLAGNDIGDAGTCKLTTRYTYDKNGNIIKKEFADGSTLEIEYDGLNRVIKNTRIVVGEGVNNKVIKETYSYAGNTDKVAKFTNGEGYVTTNIYNKKFELAEVDYADGSVVTYKYDLDGKEISKVIKDANSKSTKEYVKEYDADGNVILEQYVSKDSSGNVIYYPVKAYQYDSQGNLIKEIYGNAFAAAAGDTTEEKIKNAKGIEYSYNLENKVVSVLNIQDKQDGKKYSASYEYDVLGRKIKETDSKGNSVLYTLDMAGNILEKYFVGNVNGNNNIKILLQKNTYDLGNNVISSIDANGNKTEYVINSFGEIKIKKLPGDASIAGETYTYQYDKLGNNSVSIDSSGLITKSVYNSLDKVISKSLQGKASDTIISEKYEYDAFGNVTSHKDANGNVTTYKYDIYGNVIEKSINGKVVYRYSYDFFNNLLYTVDRFGNKITNIYDDGERLIEKRDAYGIVIEKYEYDLNGNKISTTDALGNVSKYVYDANDRVISSTDPEGIVTSKAYDSLGQVISEKDGNGNITYYTYDGLGRLISVKNALGETTVYTYDLNGNRISITDAKGNITKYNYNAANKVTEIIAPNVGNLEGKIQKYTYNADGSIKNIKDRNGNVISYEYDIFGRKIKETNGSSIITYVYDNLGNLLKVTNTADPAGDITYSYDAENRITEKSVAASTPVTITYTYDVKGEAEGEHKTVITNSKAGKITQTYDKMNRLISVNDGTDETKYTYLSDGTKSSAIFRDGSKETYSYNKNTQLITLNHIDAEGKITAVYTYKYDNNNNVTKIVDNKGTTSYVYDSLNRLVKVTEPDGTITVYTYDKAGNRITETVTKNGQTYDKAYVYDIENRLVKTVGNLTGDTLETAYTFDNNGNQIRELVTDSSLTKIVKDRNITYDNYNRVIKISQDGKTLEKNYYNYEGLRVIKETDSKKVIYIYDGTNVILELDNSGNVLARNIFGTKLISRETGSLKGFYRYNGHGDVVRIVDRSGKTLAEYYYDAFGTVKESTGSFDNPYRYAGYIYDEEADYYYMQSRMYDPSLGRFIQEDTYRGDGRDPLSLNLYTYCLNNPMIYDDQNGHWGSWISKAWNTVKSVGRKVVSGVKYVARKVVNAVKYVAHKVVSAVKYVAKKVVSTVKRAAKVVYRTVKRVGRKTVSTVRKIATQVSRNRYVKAAVSKAQIAYNYTKTQMKKAVDAVKKIDVSELAAGGLNLIQGGIAIGLGVGLTAVCPPAGAAVIALGASTGLIGFGQITDATVHVNPVKKFANMLGVSDSAYNTASEVIPFITSIGCVAAGAALQYSAVKNAFSGAEAVNNFNKNNAQAESEAYERTISNGTDVFTVRPYGSESNAARSNSYEYPSEAVAGDNIGASLKGVSKPTGRMNMAGKTHPVSGVEFDASGFPKFKSEYNMNLESADYLKSRSTHFNRASKSLYNEIQSNSELASKFTQNEIDIFKEGGVPKRFTWHHNQEPGLMQLVDRKIHRQTGHDGGYSIWGPGNK